MSLLSDADIDRRLAGMAGWTRRGDSIERTFECKNFDGSLAFVNEVGRLANEANHHPDITLSWNEVTLTLTSHDAGGLTGRDFDLAQRIDAIVSGPA